MRRFWVWMGTRPEAIKLCPLVQCLRSRGAEVHLVLSGQHRDMVHPVLTFFGVHADGELDVMREGQTPQSLTERLLPAMAREMKTSGFSPDACIVHGDTTTAFAGALCAFYADVPIAHVEAGLRTDDVRSPFPEEFNRRAIDAMSAWYFAPTDRAAARLICEGARRERVHCVGNTATDALRLCLATGAEHSFCEVLAGRRLVMLTTHRREMSEAARRELLLAIRAEIEGREDVLLLFPVHPAATVQRVAHAAFAGCQNAVLTEPLALPLMQQLLAHASLLLTDSGGLQEEATYLGIPTLVLREVTERPEGVAAGVLCVVGCEGARVRHRMRHLLDNESARLAMAHPSDVYGNGHASLAIAEVLERAELP